MSAWLGLGAAAALSAGLAAWWYGRREERVRGRGPAAVLRGLALFFLISGAWWPRLTSSDPASPRAAILLDVSSSMQRPLGGEESGSRIEAALEMIAELQQDRRAPVWTFGVRAEAVEDGTLGVLEFTAAESRVVPAIELVRATGADTLFVVTDGELTDREAARRIALRLGVDVREVRVAEDVQRLAIRELTAPGSVAGGDSLTATAELMATGRAGDTVRLRVALGADTTEAKNIEVPSDARTTTARFRIPVAGSADTAEWRPLDVIVEASPGSDVQAAHGRTWVRVTPEPTGAVMISVDPDWEARYLAPILERSVPGRVRIFLRTGQESWLEAGPRPSGGIPEERVRRAANAASLLLVQGSPSSLPPWLQSSVARRPAVAHLVRGSGRIGGTGMTVEGSLAGDWYVETPPPAGPVSAHLLGASASELPPLSVLWGTVGASEASILEARLGRRGSARPIAVLATAGERRLAVVLGEGGWRWAARGGDGLSLYRGLYSGIVRWLVDRAVSLPVELEDSSPRAGDSLRWRAAPAVRDLDLRVADATGTVVWTGESSEGVRPLTGPPLGEGDARFTARGRMGDEPFQLVVPFHVRAAREDLPAPAGAPLDVYAAGEKEGPAAPGTEPPVWPFALAIGLLCAEWFWRRRTGLR